MFRFNAVLVDHEKQVKNELDSIHDNSYSNILNKSNVISIRESRKWGNPTVAKINFDYDYRKCSGERAENYKYNISNNFFNRYNINLRYPSYDENSSFNYDLLILDFGLVGEIDEDKLDNLFNDIEYMNGFLNDVKNKIPGVKIYVKNVLNINHDNSIYNYLYGKIDFNLIDFFVYYVIDDNKHYNGYYYDSIYKCLSQIDNQYLKFIFDNYIKDFVDDSKLKTDNVNFLLNTYENSSRWYYTLPHIPIRNAIISIIDGVDYQFDSEVI